MRAQRFEPLAGVKQYKSPTSMVWLLGRIYCSGTAEDYAAVHALQDQYKLVPLSSYGQAYMPAAGSINSAIDMKTPAQHDQSDHGLRPRDGRYFDRDQAIAALPAVERVQERKIMLASKILSAAAAGERDPARLKAAALAWVPTGKQ